MDLVAWGEILDPKYDLPVASYALILNALRSFLPTGIVFVVCSLLAAPSRRGRVLRFLSRLGNTGDEQQQAAAVAALVGGNKSASNLLERAAACFCALPMDACTEAD